MTHVLFAAPRCCEVMHADGVGRDGHLVCLPVFAAEKIAREDSGKIYRAQLGQYSPGENLGVGGAHGMPPDVDEVARAVVVHECLEPGRAGHRAHHARSHEIPLNT